MKRIVLGLTLLSSFVVGVRPAAAQDYYQGGYPVGYPVQQQQGNPILKKVLIGGAIFGVGYLAGRLTAPQPNYGYGNYPPVGNQYPPNFGNHGHHGPHHHGAPQQAFNRRW
ncbi:MAG: hypothetical protein K8U03_02235 [Planctomycetia bacterium]|nr:hypothetical protein [Planctomycetia bacterium]